MIKKHHLHLSTTIMSLSLALGLLYSPIAASKLCAVGQQVRCECNLISFQRHTFYVPAPTPGSNGLVPVLDTGNCENLCSEKFGALAIVWWVGACI